MRNPRLLVVSAALVALIAAGCDDPDGEGANVVEQEEATNEDEAAPAEEEEEEEAIVGTRDNPVSAETTFVVGDWEVTVGDTDTDATDDVMAENEFNEIADGRQAVMMSVQATYIGDESGDSFDLSWAYLGSEGNTFGGSDVDDFCGVIPDDFQDAGEAFPDATIEGNVCFQVPSDQVDDGSWIVEDTFALDGGDRTFVAAS